MATESSTETFNPFPGLRPFRSEEDYLFFGREEQVAELLGLLGTHRFVTVVGTSGSGKSSLVRCGLLSELQGGSMVQAGSRWDVAVMQPGGDPLRRLARALCDADLYDHEDPTSVPQVLATLMRSRNGLVEAARQSDLEAGSNLLLVVDQFEEIFRFHEAGEKGQEQAPDFVRLLLTACEQSDVPVYVVLTMRSDFLGDCPQFAGLAEAVNEGEYLIPRLTREQSRSAIEGPARVAGGEISRRLVQRLLNDLGSETEQLPVLQHALMRTWDRWLDDRKEGEAVDLRHYEEVGGMQEALSRHADEVLESLPTESDRKVAERVFKALTEKGPDGRGVRRPSRLAVLCDIANADQETVERVIAAYRRPGVTFLMPGQEVDLRDRTVIDLSHESLMRIWERLRGWVEEESQSVRIFQRLADTARLWKGGRAGLYHDPDLQIARTWCDESRPNTTWADQHGGGFEDAMAFLEASRETADAAEREREAARRRELQQARALAATQKAAARNFKRFSLGMGVVALLAIAAMLYALRAHREAESARTEVARSLSLSDLIRGTELVERSDSLRGLGFLLRSHELDGQLMAPLEAAYNTLIRNPVPVPALDLITGDAPTLATVVQGNLLAAGDRSGVVRIHDLETGELLGQLDHGSPVVALDFSGDGELLAVGTESGSGDVWEWRDRKQILHTRYPFTPRILQVALAGPPTELLAVIRYSNGRWLTARTPGLDETRWNRASSEDSEEFALCEMHSVDGSLTIVTQNRANQISQVGPSFDRGLEFLYPPTLIGDADTGDASEPQGAFTAFSRSPDGSWLAVVTGAGIVLKSLESEAAETTQLKAAGSVGDVRFSPDSSRLVVSSDDGTATIFTVEGGAVLAVLEHAAPVREAWFSPDGLRLLTVSTDARARIWSAETGELLVEPFLHQGPYGATPFVGDGSRVLVGQAGNRLRLLEALPVSRLPLTLRSEGGIRDIAISPDGSLAASAGEDGQLTLWNVEDGTQRASLQHPGGVESVEFHPDGGQLLTVSEYGVARIWNVADRTEVARIQPPQAILETRYSTDGESLVTRMQHGAVQVWKSDTGEALGPPWRHERPVVLVDLSSDSRLVAVADESGVVLARELDTDREVLRTEDAAGLVRSLHFEPGTDRLAWVTAEGIVHVVKASTGEETLTITQEILDAQWGPEGKVLLTRCGDHTVRLWDASSGTQLGSPMAHQRLVSSAGFCPAGSRICTVSLDEARVWDAASGQPLTNSLRHEGGQIAAAQFGPQGLRLATGGEEGLLRLWDVGFPRSVGAAQEIASLAGAILGDQMANRDASGLSLEELREEWRQPRDRAASSVLARWYFSGPEERPLSPNCGVTLSSRVEGALECGDLEMQRRSVLLQPHDSRRRARLAVLRLEESKTVGARFHSRLDIEEALRRGSDDPEVCFLVGMAQALLGDDAGAEISYARARELDQPGLETLRSRIELLRRVGAASSSTANRRMLEELILRATEQASSAATGAELSALRTRKLQLLLDGSDFRQALPVWETVRADPDVPETLRWELYQRLLVAARAEFDRLGAPEKKEYLPIFTAAFLLQWFLPLYGGDLSEKWRLPDYLQGIADLETPRASLIPRRAEWKYRDDGVDLGTEWQQPEFDDSSWKSGPGRLGFPRSDGRETLLERFLPDGSQVLTYYFRHSFELEEVPQSPSLMFDFLVDDGLVLYLNGKAIFRYNMTAGEMHAGTLAQEVVGGADELLYRTNSRSGSHLREGVNVVAVEVHQCSEASSDLGFDLRLDVGLSARRFLRDLSDDAWRETITAMEPLIPLSDGVGTDGVGLREAVRLVFLPVTEGEPPAGLAQAWLAREHLLEVLVRPEEELEAAEQAVQLARAELEAAPGDPASAAHLRRSLQVREFALKRLGRWVPGADGEKPVFSAPPLASQDGYHSLDLSGLYNASRFQRISWHSSEAPGRLDDLPLQVTSFSGIPYWAGGVVQLNSCVYPDGNGAASGMDINTRFGTEYPYAITIPVDRKVSAVHFLGSTIFGRVGMGTEEAQTEEEPLQQPVARYVFRYADGTTVEEAVLWGQDVCDWVQPANLTDLRSLAWRGADASLQEKSWANPHPEKVLSSIEFISEKVPAAPFLMAVTVQGDD